MEQQPSFTDEDILSAFASVGLDPEDCWVSAGMPIWKAEPHSGRVIPLRDVALLEACARYLLRIGRPNVQLKGA